MRIPILFQMKKKKELLETYYDLHDGLSDMIEGGQLNEGNIPDDYQWLVETLEKAAVLYYHKGGRANSNLTT